MMNQFKIEIAKKLYQSCSIRMLNQRISKKISFNISELNRQQPTLSHDTKTKQKQQMDRL